MPCLAVIAATPGQHSERIVERRFAFCVGPSGQNRPYISMMVPSRRGPKQGDCQLNFFGNRAVKANNPRGGPAERRYSAFSLVSRYAQGVGEKSRRIGQDRLAFFSPRPSSIKSGFWGAIQRRSVARLVRTDDGGPSNSTIKGRGSLGSAAMGAAISGSQGE